MPEVDRFVALGCIRSRHGLAREPQPKGHVGVQRQAHRELEPQPGIVPLGLGNEHNVVGRISGAAETARRNSQVEPNAEVGLLGQSGRSGEGGRQKGERDSRTHDLLHGMG